MSFTNYTHSLSEKARLKELYEYAILDTLPEDDYDNLVAIASVICKTEVARITIIDKDRQWTKASIGMPLDECPKENAFCTYAIQNPYEVLIINDARNDDKYKNNPYVKGEPHIAFYAGVPLVNEKGAALGAVCVTDSQPKELNELQINSLKALAKQAMQLLELRHKQIELEKALQELDRKNKELDNFAHIAAHDIKSPLNNISSLLDLLYLDVQAHISKEGTEIIGYLRKSTSKLRSLVDGLLAHSKSEHLLKEDTVYISKNELSENIKLLFSSSKNINIYFHSFIDGITTNKIALEQILLNLIGNAIKYNDKEVAKVSIHLDETATHYVFKVEDNGKGISKEDQERIFELFTTLKRQDRFGDLGTGVGLATVKKMVELLGGKISVTSKIGEGTRFTFTILKERTK